MERSDAIDWETRFDWTLTAFMLGSFGLAIFLSGLQPGDRNKALWAALITGVYVVVVQAIPRDVRDRKFIGELIAVIGVVAALTAVALTGGENVGYTLMVA
ncbi:hypothetical protein, partial [Ilumatobacter sp.]|uniref:hypothetical protein n=1 Tax=Ilumatobacter sp. TaxID=1967498 RepID=UPI003C499817